MSDRNVEAMNTGDNVVDDNAVNEFANIDTGGREPVGALRSLIPTLAFIWAVFQLYFASNVPFWLSEKTGISTFIITNSDARLIHLCFAMVLACLAFPLLKSSSRTKIPIYDWVLIGLAIISTFYIIVLRDDIATRAGLPVTGDLVIATLGMITLAICVYRSLGLPLLIVSTVFVAYVFFGDSAMLPEVMQWRGASYGKAMWHYWMQNEGVFGVALGVSASLIFLFVLFGAILEKAGAGNYFIKIAFALLGHLRGGPAKAAVLASALSGLYSGSSIANTVTTGTFTIPLMKRTGFSAEKAGAVEVASSTNGQLTPPVMGAAAFLIAEFTGVSYNEIIKHALVPALVSYIALIYIVHLEALKLDLKGLPKPTSLLSFSQKMIGYLTGFIGIMVMFIFVYYGLGWIKTAYPEMTFNVVLVGVFIAYIILLFFASRHPDLEVDDPNAPITELPRAGATAITGLYYILPIIVLIWCIIIERLSPSFSAFWATLAMSFVALTQHPIKAMMRGQFGLVGPAIRGVQEWTSGMISGSRNMIVIGVATGAAGIIVGTISLTGMHQVIAEFIEFLSGGHLIVMLVLVAFMSLILGMGLPTTANYIVVSSLMAPVIVTLGAQSGLIVPLVAVHLFVFYFGILADDTPPVGLAAFAAAAISKGDPIKTGIQGFAYDIRTALLPFLFIFNTELLLIDVTLWKAIFVFVIAVIAMMLFAAATQGYFLTRNRIYETVALLLIAFTLFRPGFWLDKVAPPFDTRPASEATALAASGFKATVTGPDANTLDKMRTTTITVSPTKGEVTGSDYLESLGLIVGEGGVLEDPPFGKQFSPLGQNFDFYGDEPVKLAKVEVAAKRLPKELFYIPAFLLLGFVILLQRRRQTKPAF